MAATRRSVAGGSFPPACRSHPARRTPTDRYGAGPAQVERDRARPHNKARWRLIEGLHRGSPDGAIADQNAGSGDPVVRPLVPKAASQPFGAHYREQRFSVHQLREWVAVPAERAVPKRRAKGLAQRLESSGSQWWACGPLQQVPLRGTRSRLGVPRRIPGRSAVVGRSQARRPTTASAHPPTPATDPPEFQAPQASRNSCGAPSKTPPNKACDALRRLRRTRVPSSSKHDFCA